MGHEKALFLFLPLGQVGLSLFITLLLAAFSGPVAPFATVIAHVLLACLAFSPTSCT
jgi:hypothetical protein